VVIDETQLPSLSVTTLAVAIDEIKRNPLCVQSL
jgi:hypothetical protein